jgi:ABC-type tungstate transport system substrate-binding protein
MPSKETLAQLIELLTKVGVPTVLAGVLVWFLLTRVATLLVLGRETQLEMRALLEHCCPR